MMSCKEYKPISDIVELRKKAEGTVRERYRQAESLQGLSPEAIREIIQDLREREIELEMQNEELRRTHSVVAASRVRYQELYDTAPVGYFTISQKSASVLEANLATATLLGVSRQALIRKSFIRFIYKEDQDTFQLLRQRLLQTDERQSCELRLVREQNTTFWASLEAVTRRDSETGDLVVCVAIGDISERKRMEREQGQLRADLLQAQKMDAVGTLAGGIAHDFNNILGGVLSGLSLLELRLGVSEHQVDIQDMKILVQRGAHLAQQLLGFARQGKYDARPLDLSRVVEKTSTVFGRKHSNITIQCDVSPGPHTVLIDPSQLEQVLLNFFLNAAQAMPGGGGISVRIDRVSLTSDYTEPRGVAPGSFVKLEISDTGVGMDRATQARIFEPFFTTKHPGHGSGLGLASAYGIIRNHHGMISVESELQKGTTFTVFLPTTDLPADQALVVPTSSHEGTGLILVVDDEEQLLKLFARLLRTMGYEVLTACRGRDALELAREHKDRLSLVILDLTMPEMSGAKTFDALREIAPRLKVLLSSGYTVEGQAQELLSRGCDGFLQKPFDVATLSAKLRSLL